MAIKLVDGWVEDVEHLPSRFFNQRPCDVECLVIHCISLPEGDYGTPYIDQLFLGSIDTNAHDSFKSLEGVEVSSHFLVTREGDLKQYVSTEDRAWHAGVSEWMGRENVNDFSIGIEVEGTVSEPFEPIQYEKLLLLAQTIMTHYRIRMENVVRHSDIAPGRKTDPGPFFDWDNFKQSLGKML